MNFTASQLFWTGAAVVGIGLTSFLYKKYHQRDKINHWGNGCCPPGSEPALTTDYKDQGKVIEAKQLNFYTVGSGKKAVIVFHDIFGWNSGRTREVCDGLAAQGFLVVCPDFFHGQAMDFAMNLISMFLHLPRMLRFLWKFPWKNVEKELNEVIYPYLQQQGVTKIGCIGFCWGAWAGTHASSDERMSCHVGLHPSLQVGKFFKESTKGLLDDVKCPQMFLPAGNDPAGVKQNGEAEQILSKKSFGKECRYVEFPQMKHGWVVRGDLSQPDIARDTKLAIDQMTAFLSKHLES